MNWKRFAAFAFALLAVVLFTYQPAWSQATVSTGDIQGTITDPQGAAIAGAKVVISSPERGKSIETVTNSAGVYSSGALTPGIYNVKVSAANFKTLETTVNVQVGVIASGNMKLELGSASTVVEVTGETVAVNTEQAQVQGVLTSQQIENLPFNGRNFLDLAQLEPGVQIQDGANFDPTKTGYSSISFGGRYGRTARIQVDGTDVSDETVGTTTESIPASAIAEFQLAQSSLDLSNDLTSSGAVNVVTKSGTNSFHGEAFGAFRDNTEAAGYPGGGTFQRGQEGGNVGGPIMKDKLFFFADGEHTLQHAGAGVTPSAPFTNFTGTFASPFKEGDLLGKLDYQATKSLHIFSRFSYFSNYLVPSFGTPSYQFFANKDITRDTVVGADWTTGSFTHSIRFQYLKFQNQIADAVRGSGAPFADFPVAMTFFASGLNTGPSPDAPQATPQSDHQIKYDGSKVLGSHILRYGVSLNHIHGGGFAKFFNFAPLFLNSGNTMDSTANNCGTFVGDPSCPTNYIADFAILIGNGQGYGSEKKAFGQPFGGLGPDNRFAFYLGDTWKLRPNFTLNYGVRYVRDTGRTDSDLPPITELNAVLPGYGDKVNQPNHNFGPQLGIAWDPWNNGKTVIRAGAGLFFENGIFNNILFDRGPRLQTGTFFFEEGVPCTGGAGGPVPFAGAAGTQFIGGSTLAIANNICGSAIGSTLGDAAVAGNCAGLTTAQCVVNFQGAYQAAAAANTLGANPSYEGTLLSKGLPGSTIFDPGYKTPRSVQINAGIQRELRPGTVLSVDYLRNVGTHFLISVAANHPGDAALLDVPAAQQAIATTLANCGVASINAAITLCPANPSGAPGPYTPRPATIGDFAGNGLDSPGDLGTGVCNASNGFNPLQTACAFPGTNPNIGPVPVLLPVVRSVYNALDIKLTQNVNHPFTGVKYLNFQFSYALSKATNPGSANGLGNPGTPANSDQDFIDGALDDRNPNRFAGPNGLDRLHQFNFGGYATLPYGFQLSTVAHFWSPLAITPLIDVPASPAAIYQSDFTGSGVPFQPLPKAQTDPTCGTMGGNCNYTTYNTGAYGRTLEPGSLSRAVNNYNATIAGQQVTPAGQALINAGLMTQAQLIALGATPPAVTWLSNPVTGATTPGVIPGQVGLSWMRTMDVGFAWVGHFWHERLTLTPGVNFFNVFNFVNYDPAGSTLSGALSGDPGALNGTNPALRTNRISNGSGIFNLGSPRTIEWNLKLQF
jgi:Carboxypeptidase regulatory-like domain